MSKLIPFSGHHLLVYLLAFLTFVNAIHVCVSAARPTSAAISRTITVDIAGRGDFTSVQAAIDSVPIGNTQWVRIFIKRGTYREKVLVPQSRPFIAMEGEGAGMTVIQWGDYVGSGGSGGGGNPKRRTADTGTFALWADNFVARGITFENAYSRVPGNPQTQAMAALLEGDMAAFYSCGFVGFQDTLADNRGRHYFRDCYIEGFADFIFGSGQSIYDRCKIWVSRSPKPYGYITAHGRNDPQSPGAFVFNRCTVDGEGLAYLGRSWGTHPVVLFYKTYMSKVVHPLGWDPFNKEEQEPEMAFAEKDCRGPGSDRSGRVKWAKNFTDQEIQRYTSMSFIDQDGWLRRQPGAGRG
ncbi:hypothetical protein Taro_052682 [Colocasia esculenta]|uniref:Pectinesterase n=1 Tax=Colocasia esculenta TaxID=4460 RepID=A0A843XJ81_COLES|nr:hypothetical protein [Colocasia esculenta]